MDLSAILFLLFIAANVILTGIVIACGIGIVRYDPPAAYSGKPLAFTLLICTKDRLATLRNNLSAFLNQVHQPDEILVIIDGSRDGTLGWLFRMARQNPHLRVIYLQDKPREIAGKKGAMVVGIERASHQWILCTDDDCTPAGVHWSESMLKKASGEVRIVTGIAPINGGPGFTGRIAEFDGFFTAMQSTGLASLGMPYMGIGRNLLFHRSVYDVAGGFGKHAHILSGDDDLLVNKVATSRNAVTNLDPLAFVFSPGKESWPDYLRQKRRHARAGLHYRGIHKWVLGLWNGSLLVVYVLLIPACIVAGFTLVLPMFMFFLFLRWVVAAILAGRLGYSRISVWYPILEGVFSVTLVIIAASLFRKSDTWN